MLYEYYNYVKAGDVTRIRGIHTLTILIAALCVFVARGICGYHRDNTRVIHNRICDQT